MAHTTTSWYPTDHRTDEEKKLSGNNPASYDRLVIATLELKALLQICGKASGGTFDSLQRWFPQCREKGLSDQYKMTIIRKHVMNTTNYDDAEVPLSILQLNMAIKRNWVGKDNNITRP